MTSSHVNTTITAIALLASVLNREKFRRGFEFYLLGGQLSSGLYESWRKTEIDTSSYKASESDPCFFSRIYYKYELAAFVLPPCCKPPVTRTALDERRWRSYIANVVACFRPRFLRLTSVVVVRAFFAVFHHFDSLAQRLQAARQEFSIEETLRFGLPDGNHAPFRHTWRQEQ